MKTAIIEVRGGIATAVRKPNDVKIEIVDLDLLREGDIDAIKQYWSADLSSRGRNYVKRNYRKTFEWITNQIKD
ncbi:MAG TPA: hypothetical protein VF011_16805 [Terriglobales bacterium]